jgi:hypothetical protein
MINRRMFLGATLVTAGGIIDLPAYNRNFTDNIIPGKIKSYRFELDKIDLSPVYNDSKWGSVANFPLEDKLIIAYDGFEETYFCYNWQIRGLPFDVREFLNTELEGTFGLTHRNYNGHHKFFLQKVVAFSHAA